MPDLRAYCAAPPPAPAELILSPDESHHLVSVNRARRGDTVIAFDGTGREWTTELVGDRKQGAVLRVRESHIRSRPAFDITLAQAMPKGPAMDAIVRKATEIGVTRIIPLETERTQVHLEAERSEKKLEKWRTAALEAAKQCGNPFLPEIRPLTALDTVLAEGHAYPLRLMASLEPGAKSLKTILGSRGPEDQRTGGPEGQRASEPRGHSLALRPSAIWLVGPEGDFSPAEWERAKAAGFQPVTLGPLVLRCETAAIYALSVLSYELGSW